MTLTIAQLEVLDRSICLAAYCKISIKVTKNYSWLVRHLKYPLDDNLEENQSYIDWINEHTNKIDLIHSALTSNQPEEAIKLSRQLYIDYSWYLEKQIDF